MSESEETKWRLGAEPEEAEESTTELSYGDDEKKEELQQQSKAEEIGGGGEGSLVTRPEEVPITGIPQKTERIAKAKRLSRRGEPDSGKNMMKMSKQLERQENQLTRIEKVLLPLQKSVSLIDKQSNTIKQLYTVVTQLQKQIPSTKNRKQNHGSQKKKSLKGRR
jgi:hypothetical protein